jgi:tetrahydromethanopterin S-methyltransferase subunit E
MKALQVLAGLVGVEVDGVGKVRHALTLGAEGQYVKYIMSGALDIARTSDVKNS